MTIREARKALGMTQQELAECLQIPKRTIANWESGDRNPPEYVERLVVEKLQSMKKNQTNADRIRAMSDEELADFLVNVETRGYYDGSVSGTLEMVDWLKSELW